MKKKILIIVIICLICLACGILYSCKFIDFGASGELVTSLEDGHTDDGISLDNSGDDTQGEDKDKNSQLDTINTDTDDLSHDNLIESRISIHICGAVNNPGVYETNKGARLIDLIELAGGLSDEAAGDYINQAQVVDDGQRTYIPTRQELEELSIAEYMQGESVVTENSLVNINKAGVDELTSLPGIGQAKANSIIKYRNNNGKFITIEDIMKIPGIKEGLFNQISSYITVE